MLGILRNKNGILGKAENVLFMFLHCLRCSIWLNCEILTDPAIEEKATRFQVAIFHSISRDI